MDETLRNSVALKKISSWGSVKQHTTSMCQRHQMLQKWPSENLHIPSCWWLQCQKSLSIWAFMAAWLICQSTVLHAATNLSSVAQMVECQVEETSCNEQVRRPIERMQKGCRSLKKLIYKKFGSGLWQIKYWLIPLTREAVLGKQIMPLREGGWHIKWRKIVFDKER